MKFQNPLQAKRFWSKVKITGGCWEWTASKDGCGYGTIGISCKVYRAHRVAYTNYVGQIPDGLHVCHRCDNPSCVKLGHLFLGTRSDNISDCVKKGRFNKPKGSKHHKAKLNENEVSLIKTLLRFRSNTEDIMLYSRMFRVSNATIYLINKKQTWVHVT